MYLKNVMLLDLSVYFWHIADILSEKRETLIYLHKSKFSFDHRKYYGLPMKQWGRTVQLMADFSKLPVNIIFYSAFHYNHRHQNFASSVT